MARVLLIGAVYYARQVADALVEAGCLTDVLTIRPDQREREPGWQEFGGHVVHHDITTVPYPDLIVVAGWRRLIPANVLAMPRLGTVGFHSAKLPEYPGRAPVPWTLLRGDALAWNTMLFLDGGIDTGDIIDERSTLVMPGTDPWQLYDWVATSSVWMLMEHLPALLEGRAPRRPQDMSRRGPLTTPDGWNLWWLQHQADAFG